MTSAVHIPSNVPGGLAELRFRELCDALPAAIYATDAGGCLTYFNGAAVKLSGRVPELGTDKWCVTWKLFLPDGSPMPHDQCPMALVLKGQQVDSGLEYIAERPDGVRFWFTPYPAVLRDAAGTIVGGVNVLIDITARKLAQAESEEQFRAIFETNPECVKLVAADGTLLHMNAAGLAMLGAADAASVTGLSVYDFLAPEHRDRFREFNSRVCCGEKASLEFDLIAPGGARRQMESHAAPLVRSGHGTVQLAVTRDVTERKRTERAALHLSAIVDSSEDAIISKDLNGVITSWNRSAERLFGYQAEEAIGKSITILIPPDRLQEEPRILARICAGERIEHFETVRRRKDGTLLDIALTISPVKDARGTIIGASKIARDITDMKRAERANRLLGAVVDSSADAIITKDLEGVITSWNHSAERLFGYTVDEAVGQRVAMLLPPDRLDEEAQILDRLRRGEQVAHFDSVRRRKDGSLVDVALTISPIKDSAGVIVGISKIARDITELKRAQRANRLLGAIVDSSDDAIISKDLNGVITSWNHSAERLFGYTAAEAVGQPVTILIPPERLDEEPDILARLRRGDRVDHFETIRRRKDGTLLDISLTISPVRDRHGNVVGASKIARDITERKRFEAALLESEGRFRQLADSMPQIVWTARPDGYIDYYNERWYEFTEFPRDRFGDLSWEAIIHPDDVQRSHDAWYDAVRSGRPYHIEHRFWDRHQNRWRWFMGRALPVSDASGRIVKWFGSSTDIDDQKRVEDELRQANQDLQQFAFSASHDLQEPLRSVNIYSELLTKRYSHKLDGEALDFLRFMRTGATRMENLVRDLLSYTQVSRPDAVVEPADAAAALYGTLDNLADVIAESEAVITNSPLPRLRVHSAHLQQLFQNLVGNAIKYRSPDRPLTVHVSAERHSEHWLFSVSDNGIGINPRYKESIFGLFKRLHTSDQYSGTGIGLAICQRIVERYQGRIWVESEPDRGSTFRFTLPV